MTVHANAAAARPIFTEALKRRDSESRKNYLDSACGDDALLREQVEFLLRASREDAESPLEQAARQIAGSDLPTEPAITEAFSPGASGKDKNSEGSPGTFDISEQPQIGPYKIRELLGEGGMGYVYVAEQHEPLRRKVALKLIKPGMDSREVIARFEAERQALAMMSHPNIAQVFDGGVTEQGRPYFVMELVRGSPITEFCDENQLNTRERLELFLVVCQAVQHAHMKGIIHRDLKPSNVIVELHDVHPVPKIIDFGIAKATGDRLSKHTVYTQFTQLVGTPLYMSPEQAKQSALDIDTRSDIYSLGVMLYELLTGITPFDRSVLNSADVTEMRRIICEVDPPRPSNRVSTLKSDRLSTISASRRMEPQQLSLSMQRELDWIVMRAMEKDRTRRYQSATAMAQDIQRFLNDQPVEACPPSLGYRFHKLLRRHKRWIAAGTLIATVLVVATFVSAHLAIRASESEQVAEQATEQLRELLYESDVMLATQDWRQNDVELARSRLMRHIPQNGQRDLRGFEWNYLWKQHDVSGVQIADVGVPVYDIEISPGGDRFAAVGADAMIRVFGLEHGNLQLTIPTQQVETNGIAFSPDGGTLASVGDDGTLRVWDLGSQRELVSVAIHEGRAFQVVYSPDGSIVATCGEDDRVRLWDATDGSSLGTLNENDDTIETIVISNGGIVAAGDKHSQMTLWDLAKRKLLWGTSQRRFDAVDALAISKTGYVAHGTAAGQLTITEIENQTVAYRRRFANGIQSVAFAPSGLWMCVGDRSGHLFTVPFENGVWDLDATRKWSAHKGRIYNVEVTPDGQRILSVGVDGRIMSWEPFAGTSHRVVQFESDSINLIDAGSDQIAVSTDAGVYLCDLSGNIVHQLGHEPGRFPGWHIDFASEVDQLFGLSTFDSEVVAWNVVTGEEVFRWQWKTSNSLDDLVVVPNGKLVVLRTMDVSGDREIQLLDIATEEIVAKFPVHSAKYLDVSADGRWLAFDSNNDISLLDLDQRRIVTTGAAHEGAIEGLQFSLSRPELATISEDRTLKLWSVPGGQLISWTVAHRTGNACLSITSDGTRVATGSDDRMLRFWDGGTLHRLWESPIQTGPVRGLCFFDDDHRLACLCGQHFLVILDGSPVEDLTLDDGNSKQ